MDAPAILTLICVGLAVVAIATYLIIIAMILKRVVNRLVIILGGVGQSTQRAEPVGAVIADINRDLESGRMTLEACVQRLVARHGAPNGDVDVEPQAVAARRPMVRTGYSAASAAADEAITKRANLRRGDTFEPPVPREPISGPRETGPRPGGLETGPRPGGLGAEPPSESEERGGGAGRRWWNR